MTIKTINGMNFSIGKLNAMQQLHLVRRIAPIATSLIEAVGTGNLKQATERTEEENAAALAAMVGPLSEAAAALPEADVDWIMGTCLGVVERDMGANFAPVAIRGTIMQEDLPLPVLLQLVAAVVKENLGTFLPAASTSN